MPTLRLTQQINAPVATVFETVSDLTQFPRWNPTTKSARRLDSGPIGEGSRFELEVRGFGKVVQELQDFEANRRVRLVPHMRMLGGGHRFSLTPSGDATTVEHELEMAPHGLLRLLTPIVGILGRRNLSDTAGALKRHLEDPSAS